MKNESITVSEFNALINQTLSFAYPEIVVEGEVSSYKLSQGKWVFFDLKDSASVVGCFMPIFNLKSSLEDGMLIRVKAVPQVTKWGKFSLTVRDIELAGEGSAKRDFELMKQKFEKEGLFSQDRKRSLPDIPERILLITSRQAAAFNDFITIINDRWAGIEIDHLQVQVQGRLAAEQIEEAISYGNSQAEQYDALVLIRGGGSAEDLQAFNTDQVVRAVYGSTLPTMVAIGHEDDVSLAELVADVRAATPTDAARRLVPDKSELLARISATRQGMLSLLGSQISSSRSQLDRFYYSIELRVNALRHDSAEVFNRSCNAMDQILVQSKNHLSGRRQLLASLDPRAILARGYSIARIGGRVLSSSSDYSIGDTVVIQLHEGTITIKEGSNRKNEDQQSIQF